MCVEFVDLNCAVEKTNYQSQGMETHKGREIDSQWESEQETKNYLSPYLEADGT